MTTITISRQFGSGGDEIAELVNKSINFQVFDKHIIALAARDSGLSDQEIIDFSEDNYKVRNFLDRIFNRSHVLAQVQYWREDNQGIRISEVVPLDEEIALALVQNAIRSAHRKGNMIIVGRGGQAILRGESNALHVRIVAPMEERIQRVKELLKSSEKTYPADISIRREAQDLILAHDEASKDYLNRFYKVDLDDPLLYHLVINTGKVNLQHAAELIVEAVRKLNPIEKIYT
jgi:cytidylate kinase